MESKSHDPADLESNQIKTMNKNLRAGNLSNLFRFLLILSLVQSATWIGRAQQQRERRTTPAVTVIAGAATPAPSPSELPNGSPAQIPQSLPTVTPAQTKAVATTSTLAELQSRISQILQKPELAPALVGIKVASLGTGHVLFEENANKLLRPASNMKLYTVAAALDRLSPEFRFVTSVYAPARPDAAGIIHGDLTIFGRGDPSIAARFNNGDYFKGIDDLTARIVAAGVKRVEGDLVGDETYFTGPQYGTGWDWDDLTWWYGAEVSALTVNDNALDLSIKPGDQVGSPAIVTTGPPDPLLKIANRVVTSAKGTPRDLAVYRGLASDDVEVQGSIALDDKGYSGGLGISRPALLFVYLLRSSLAQHGVTISGKTRTIAARTIPAATNSESPVSRSIEVATLRSPPLSVIAAKTLKPSQNLYTELILRTLGKVPVSSATAVTTNRTSEAAGIEIVKTFLREAGVDQSTLVLSDGSGLSRNDMVTAEATLQLLTYMHRHRYATVFREALPIAGVDGTLKNRLKGTLAENNLRAKTGTLSSAISLSGFVRDAAGEDLVFSIMVNNYQKDTDIQSVCIDPIAILLASFAGKSCSANC
jgi:D-alanyl-D-alanine carboxypeptidase/D-alanyl-D-alanine-endopeptidase (penicillin-binding protein 4)